MQVIFVILLLIISVRGALILHLGLNSDLLYKITAITFVIISFSIFYNMIFGENFIRLKKTKFLSMLVCIVISYYAVAHILFGGIHNLSLLYTAFFAPSCVYFAKISLKHNVLLLFIYLSTVMGVYYISYVGFNDLSKIDEIQNFLRPNDDRVDRLGITFRNGGYQGSCHDAANILSIIGVFLIANILTKKSNTRFISLCALLIGTPALFLTTSASNIAVFLFVSLVMLIFYSSTLLRLFISTVTTFIFTSLIFYYVDENILIFTNKFIYHSETSNSGMFNSLDEESIFSSFFSFIFGFAYILEQPIISTEIGIIKLLVTFGFIPFLLLLVFLSIPIYFSFKKGINTNYFYYSFPLIASLLSLLHYASLFRITSIGVLILLYSNFLVKYFNLDHSRSNCR